MNIEDYIKLCRNNDSILLSKNSNILTNSISSLHVRRFHPEEAELYKPRISKFYIKLFLKLKFFFSNIIFEKKNFYKDDKYFNFKKIDCLIISNLINDNIANEFKDNYFGNLESDLNKLEINTATIIKNFSNISNFKLFKKFKNNKQKKIILSKRLGLFSEFYLISLTIYEIIRNKILRQNINSTYFFSIPSNLRISIQVLKIIKKNKPKIILFTYEGHAWERVLIKKIKEHNNKIICAGYQFGSLTKNHHSIYRKLKKGYNPDIILTSGKITEKYFIDKNNFLNTKIKILGSYKRKNESILNKYKLKEKNNTFLIVPEGFETKKIFNFIIECARLYNDYDFIYKIHPEVKDELINSLILELDKNKLDNIRVSKSNIDLLEEIKLSNFIIYRGSIAVFEGCLNGLLPIYYNAFEKVDINPLFKFFDDSLIINKPNDLEAFKNIKKFDDKLNLYKKISRDYFEKINPVIVKDLLIY